MTMAPAVSIILSVHNRLPLWRRTLWSMAYRPPSVPFEVVVVDDGSTEPILEELQLYSSAFPWKFLRYSKELFEKATGVRAFFNNPASTNNLGFRHCSGNLIFLQGSEVIAWGDVYDRLLGEVPEGKEHFLVFSSTLDVPRDLQAVMDPYGANLTPAMVASCEPWILQTPYFPSDVTNYLSLTSRKLWEDLGGYDERYVGGLGKEDSDFVRRCRAHPGWKDVNNLRRSEALSLHQNHGGRTFHAKQDQDIISDERWAEGERLSKAVWDQWDGTHKNSQPWPWGEYGLIEVLSNV